MFELLDNLTDSNFMPHGHCYLWRPDILWLHVGSDLVIALAYYMIPVILAVFLYKRGQAIPYREIVALFVAFIFLCGTTHLIDIVTTWQPAYVFEGYVKAITGSVSIITAIVLAPKLPDLLSLPGLKQAYEELQSTNRSLELKTREMQSVYTASIEREKRILELKAEVNALLEQMHQPARYHGESPSPDQNANIDSLYNLNQSGNTPA